MLFISFLNTQRHGDEKTATRRALQEGSTAGAEKKPRRASDTSSRMLARAPGNKIYTRIKPA